MVVLRVQAIYDVTSLRTARFGATTANYGAAPDCHICQSAMVLGTGLCKSINDFGEQWTPAMQAK